MREASDEVINSNLNQGHGVGEAARAERDYREKGVQKYCFPWRSSFFYIYSNLFRTIDKDKTERSEQYAFRSFRSGKADAY